MLNRTRIALQVGILLLGIFSFLTLSIESIRLNIPEKNYWPNWTSESFDCLKNELSELEINEVVSLEITDPLLFQRIVEVGFPEIDFSSASNGIKISDVARPERDLVETFECGNWKVYVSK